MAFNQSKNSTIAKQFILRITNGGVFLLLFVGFIPASYATQCLSPSQSEMADTKDIVIPGTKYRIGFCYREARGKNKDHYRDDIILKMDKKWILKFQTDKSNITVGRVSDLKIDQVSKRFIAVSYTAGEFCNGIVIFDIVKNKISYNRSCVKQNINCQVTSIFESKCKAAVRCQEQSDEDVVGPRKESVIEVDICRV